MMKRFTKREEDFVCANCEAAVTGTGYTNHCPKCLFSKHVDVNPGDREALCGGMMQPIGIESKNREERIIHQCLRCGFLRKNKIAPQDSYDAVISIAKKSEK